LKRNSSAPPYLLQVSPRGGRLPEEVPVALNPARGELIKHEPITLIWREVLADGRQAVVKLYRRGLAVWCRSLATGFRVQCEFDGLSQLETLGIPCSVPLFWSHGHFGPHGWGEILVTEWVVQSQSLRDLLVTRSEISRSLDLSPLFADMARMHAVGLHHGMLRTRNILVKNHPERPAFAFIDMPRFHRFPRDIRGTRMAHYDLMVLYQGLLPYFPEDTVLLWLSAYGIPEPEKMDLLVRLKRFRSTGFLRRIWGAEFNVRSAMAQLLAFSPRNTPESQ
jgi:tRNA A-37 threonylcarbamoyl transferase component Bud32